MNKSIKPNIPTKNNGVPKKKRQKTMLAKKQKRDKKSGRFA